MKKTICLYPIIFAILVAIVLTGGFPKESIAQKTFWKIGTAGSGGAFYFLGAAVANVVNNHVKEIKLTAEGTAGGTENLRRMTQGELELAIISPWDLPTVLDDKTGKKEKFSFFCGAHNSICYFVSRKSSGWKTMKEAMHKEVKMSTGAPGSGTRISFLYFLEAFGLSLQDIKSHPLAFNEAAEALKDGNIELFYSAGGIPVAGVSSVSQAIDAVILEFTQDDIKRLQKICSAMYGFVVPAKSYRGQEKDVLTAAYGAMLIARSDLNPQLVYNVIKALYENQDELARIHPTGKELNIQRAFVGADYSYSLGVKHHPGVVKYLKEEQKWDKKYD